MRVLVNLNRRSPTATMTATDDFGSFGIELIGVSAGHRVTASDVACVGVLDSSGDVLVTVARIGELAGDRSRDPDWTRRFGEMVEWAARRGWVDESGRLRAHVELSEVAR
ncbi:hypothetical protein AB0L57_22900 [Nocardia sp. NPDC052254]|uniref:hypothetical protein n=1 Tax=Nocardia sp. NPDC052254 TaxID=3155681 RepID=UPI00341A53A1